MKEKDEGDRVSWGDKDTFKTPEGRNVSVSHAHHGSYAASKTTKDHGKAVADREYMFNEALLLGSVTRMLALPESPVQAAPAAPKLANGAMKNAAATALSSTTRLLRLQDCCPCHQVSAGTRQQSPLCCVDCTWKIVTRHSTSPKTSSMRFVPDQTNNNTIERRRWTYLVD